MSSTDLALGTQILKLRDTYVGLVCSVYILVLCTAVSQGHATTLIHHIRSTPRHGHSLSV